MTVQNILIDHIYANSKDNVRSEEGAYKGPAFDELVNSIKAMGVLQPVLVRAYEHEQYKWELVAGYRRVHAALIAGATDVPAYVRTLDDQDVLTARVTENLQRSDPHPMDHAAAIRKLEGGGISHKEIATLLGKNEAFVAKFRSLNQLIKPFMEWYRAGLIYTDDAIAYSRLPEKEQKRIHKEMKSRGGKPDHPENFAGDYYLEKAHVNLGDAPFDTKDAQLVPVAGACSKCPKCTGNQRALFSDIKQKDICVDRLCYEGKVKAFWKIASKQYAAAGATVWNMSEAEKNISPHGPVQDKKLVDYNATLWEGSHQLNPAKLLKNIDHAECTFALDSQGNIRQFVKKSAVIKAFKDSAPKLKKGESADDIGKSHDNIERKKRKLANAQGRDLHTATLEALRTHKAPWDCSDNVKADLYFLTLLHAQRMYDVTKLLPETADEDTLKEYYGEKGISVQKIVDAILPKDWNFNDMLALHVQIAHARLVSDPGHQIEPQDEVVWASQYAGVNTDDVKKATEERLKPKAKGKKA